MEKTKLSQNYTRLKEKFFERLAALHYSPDSHRHYKRTFEKLENFMSEHGVSDYSNEIGMAFIEDSNGCDEHAMRLLKAAVRRLTELMESNTFYLRKKRNIYECPDCFQPQFDDYLKHLRLQGKRESTIECYRQILLKTFYEFRTRNINNLSELHPQDIYAAFEKSSDKHNFSTPVRGFLKYLFKKGVHTSDLSLFVISVRRSKPVPSVYSSNETDKLLSYIDRTTVMGKRDYAVVLLALRLGMRSGDILNLKINDVDFNTKTIAFTQRKTLVPQRLALLPEIDEALSLYLTCRIHYGSPYIFISEKAPFDRLSDAGVKNIVKKYFKAANIDTQGRKSGGHALRMTFASELVSEAVPYDVIRKILGHEDPEAIKHYVKLDIEMLRQCALEVPQPTGLLAEKLFNAAGGEVQ
jgi:site-specific recombinase XerD